MTALTGSSFRSKMARYGKVAGAALAGGIALEAKRSVSAFEESLKVTGQTAAVIKSTGGAAKVTAKHVADLATQISLKSGIDDEAIQSGQNMLLTFKNVRNEAGAGNKIFDQTSRVLTDMSVAMDQSAKSSAIQLGKALNDPIAGMSALSRVGVTFTDQQKAQITGLEEHNHLLGAQKIILKELTSEFGGSAAAQATSTDKLRVAWGNLEEQIGGELYPTFTDLADQLTHVTKLIGSDKLTSDEKFSKIGQIIEDDFSTGLDAVVAMIPTVASQVGQQAPKIVEGLVNGFLHADAWGKLALGAFLLRKMGGISAITAIGRRMGGAMGGGIAGGIPGIPGGGSVSGLTGIRGGGVGSLANPIMVRVEGGGLPGGGPVPVPPGGGRTPLTWGERLGALGRLGLKGGGTAGLLAGITAISAAGADATSQLYQLLGWGDPVSMPGGKHGPAGGGSVAGHPTGTADAARNLRVEIQKMSEAGKEIPLDLIKKAGLDPQTLRDAGVSVVKYTDAWKAQMRAVAKATGESTDQVKHDVGGMKIKVSDDYAGMVEVSVGGMTALVSNTNSLLKGLGVNQEINWHSTAASTAQGNADRHHWRQRGGMIPGLGSGDTVPVWAEPGEGFINREAVKGLGGPAAIDWINNQWQRFQGGGVLGVQRSYPRLSGDLDFLPALGNALSRMAAAAGTNISVQEGYRTRSEQAALYAAYLAGTGNLAARPGTSEHEVGTAADISPGREVFGSLASRFGLAFDVPSEAWHIALMGGGGARGTAPPATFRLARMLLEGPPGAMRSTGQGALDKARAALLRYGKHKTSFAGVTGTGGSVSANEALGRRMMLAAGWGAGQWPALDALWNQESGWNANAVNPSSGAYGIPQSLGHGHPYALGDARAQIAWGLNYIRERYGSPGAAWGHEQAFNWYGNGADFIARRPQLIGVGDGGPERVRITPNTPLAAADRPVRLRGELKITNWREGIAEFRGTMAEEIEDAERHHDQLSRMSR
jgi:hypothetical protein